MPPEAASTSWIGLSGTCYLTYIHADPTRVQKRWDFPATSPETETQLAAHSIVLTFFGSVLQLLSSTWKQSDSLPCSRSLIYLVWITHCAITEAPQTITFICHAWKMAPSTSVATSYLFCVTRMFLFLTQTPETKIYLLIKLFCNLLLSNACVVSPILIFSLCLFFSILCHIWLSFASKSCLFKVDIKTGVFCCRHVMKLPAEALWGDCLFLKLETLMYLSTWPHTSQSIWLEPVYTGLCVKGVVPSVEWKLKFWGGNFP